METGIAKKKSCFVVQVPVLVARRIVVYCGSAGKRKSVINVSNFIVWLFI